MITPSSLLTCQEWENLPESCNLTESEADRLYDLAKHSARRLKLPEDAVLTRTRHGLKAGQVVGILVIPRKTLEILPKIDGENSNVREALVRMLAVSYNLRVVDGKLAALAVQQHDLLEMLVRLFADQLLAAVRRGLPRRYISHEEDLKLLRGKAQRYTPDNVSGLSARPIGLSLRRTVGRHAPQSRPQGGGIPSRWHHSLYRQCSAPCPTCRLSGVRGRLA